MPYCTLTDLKKLIPEVAIIQMTDDEGLGAINDARVTEAIASADAEIDAYCGTKYAMPFTAVPDIVKKMSADIAIYNLYARQTEAIPETRADRYKNAIRFLRGISDGRISIGEAITPETSAVADKAATNKTDVDRIFNKDNLSGF